MRKFAVVHQTAGWAQWVKTTTYDAVGPADAVVKHQVIFPGQQVLAAYPRTEVSGETLKPPIEIDSSLLKRMLRDNTVYLADVTAEGGMDWEVIPLED